MTAIGNWNLTMDTPMGKQTGLLAITDEGGTLAAGMTGPDGEVQPATDVTQDGDTLKFKIAVKKPIPLGLHFNVTIDGDSLSGTFRPGMFPPSPVTGVRA